MDLLPGEQQPAEEAKKEVESFQQRHKREQLKRKPVRKPLPEDLPRIEEHLYSEETKGEEECWVELSPEVTEVLEYEPGKCYVRRIIRHKYVWKENRSEETAQIATAKLPTSLQPIARSYARATLLAELMIGKYVYHLPFYRQLQMLGQMGVNLPPPTVNDWFKDTADLRERLSDPIMVAFEKWLVREYPQVMPRGRIGKAIKYTYEIYHRLTRYHLDGRYRIDNNMAENSWLFY